MPNFQNLMQKTTRKAGQPPLKGNLIVSESHFSVDSGLLELKTLPRHPTCGF